MSRILILGGSGFIGTRLVGLLAEAGHDVLIGDIAPSEVYPALWTRLDVRDDAGLRPAVEGRDWVINLAAAHRDDVQPRSLYDEVNVEGARVVTRAAAEAGVRQVLFTSSVAIYGFSRTERLEDHPAAPFNDYGRTKLEAEEVYRSWYGGASDRTLVIVRPTVVFGEGNRGNVYNLVKQVASGRFVMIGDGRNVKSVAYVENVAECLRWCLGRPPGYHLYNYADKPDFDMNRLVALVRGALGLGSGVGLRLPKAAGFAAGRAFDALAAATGRSFPISAIRVRKFVESTRIGSDRVLLAGFRPPVPLEEGLRRTLAREFGAGAGAPAPAEGR